MSDSSLTDTQISFDPKQLSELIAKNWWIALIRGIFLVALGIYALISPGITMLAWAFVVGCFLVADGLLAIIAGVAGWAESRGWFIIRGILAILFGGFAIAHPAVFGAIAGITVVAIVAGFSIAGGILEIVVAIRERKAIKGEGWMILNGVFGILFGVVLLLAPLLSLDLFIRVSGVFAALFGVVVIFTSLQFRKLKSTTASE